MCRECPVGGTGTLKQSLGPAARVFTDAKRTVSVSKCDMHRDHGLPPVAVVGVFVLFPPPLLTVVPGLVPVPGLFGVPLLRLSLLSCKGGCTNAISHLLADSEYCPRGRSGHRPKYRYPLSFFEAITKGRRPKNRALQCQVLPTVLTYGYWATWLILCHHLHPHLGPRCLLPCSPSSHDLCACPFLTLTVLFRLLGSFESGFPAHHASSRCADTLNPIVPRTLVQKKCAVCYVRHVFVSLPVSALPSDDKTFVAPGSTVGMLFCSSATAW